MPLIVLCGHPCCGKSKVANFLQAAMEAAGHTVVVLGEGTLGLTRSEAYKDNNAEKNLRGLLRSEVDRTVTKDKVVIVDSLNGIKGYRYELWCIARAAGTKYCMVHCDAPEAKTRMWNVRRKQEERYPPEIMNDLLQRFERPDGRNRWDKPLFTVDTDQNEPTDLFPVLFDIIEAMINKKPNLSVDLQPTVATEPVRLSETNSLYELDRATQEIINTLTEAQASGQLGWVRFDGLPAVHLERSLGLPELRRYKRTFLKLARASPPQDERTAQRMFLDYMNREIGPSPFNWDT